jgi:PelA/Pel-15E family pectate lyase
MSWVRALSCATLLAAGCSSAAAPSPADHVATGKPAATNPSEPAKTRALALATMKRATKFMLERASYRGGYVWAYLPDFSRRWGELEATETMIWVQRPGTATMGQVFLDAYRATGDDAYYEAAARAADALVAGQHESGGWNYVIDFAGEASLRRWYGTIGKNAWRLEEFQHYYGSATFDDGGTAESTRLLLRLFVERREPKYRIAVERALRFVLESQHANGCWPQRHPMTKESTRDGQPEYPGYDTFNDDVAAQNIDVLLMAYRVLGDDRVLEPVRRAMDCFLLLELPPPQPGWSLQYSPDRKPAAARTYEPAAVSTKTTAENIAELMNFYALTGDAKYLERVPAALDWLESLRLPGTPAGKPHAYPEFVAVGSNRPMFVHRRGSNVANGAYYFDENPQKTIVHSKQIREYDTAGLRARYRELKALPAAEVSADSALVASKTAPLERFLPRFFTDVDLPLSNLTHPRPKADAISREHVERLARELDDAGYWPTRLERISHPYRGPSPREVAPGDFSETEVGDAYDTSPYRSDDAPLGISTRAFVKNLFALVRYVDATK